MAQSSGFSNAIKENGAYAPKYNANHYNDNLAAIISNGVRRSSDNDLKVNAAGGMNLSINIGRAWIEGRWYKNDTVFTEFSVPTAPTGDRKRIDRVVLRLDTSVSARFLPIQLVYLTGTVGVTPTAPALTRTNSIFEIALADIEVNAGVTSILQENITDHRSNKEVCGWITTPIGYDDWFENHDKEFLDWFKAVKDTLSSVTLFKEYHQEIIVESAGSTFAFNIPQYDPTGVDVVQVYVNGFREIEGVDYSLNDRTITFVGTKTVGTSIDVFVYKSIDGTGLGSVSAEITELQNKVAKLSDTSDFNYVCTGVNDNIKLSDLAQAFLSGADDHKTMTIHVYGELGIQSPYAGSGTTSSRYRLFSLGTAAKTSRRVIFDFENCSQIKFNCSQGYHYIMFYGMDVYVKKVSLNVNCEYESSSFTVFSSTQGAVNADLCEFVINGNNSCEIGKTGTFNDCFGNVFNSNGDSFCFNVASTGLLRVNGGEFYAYSGLNSAKSAVVYIAETATAAGAVLSALNCPTVEETGKYQSYAVQVLSGHCTSMGLITGLTVSNVITNIGQIARSKNGRL